MQNLMSILTGTVSSLNLMDVIINVSMAGLMSWLVYLVFVRFGNTFSNRKHFGRIFFMITVCTTMIISVIQASLALSLGLVGALSIVRFRTAIKEPEELAYTFFCITMGLGFGANLRGLTILCGLLVLVILILRGLFTKSNLASDTYNFSVISKHLSLSEVMGILKNAEASVTLRRADHESDILNAHFVVEFSSVAKLEKVVELLKTQDSEISTSFISNSTFM